MKRKHFTRLVLEIQHATPSIHIPEYQTNILRILKPEDIQPTQWRTSTSTVLHLYTEGITHDAALMFFAPLLLEYIRSQLEGPTQIRVKVINIRPLLQYGSLFPDTLFEKEENRVQLYVQVHILDMVECAEIQRFLTKRIVQQEMSGINMQVELWILGVPKRFVATRFC